MNFRQPSKKADDERDFFQHNYEQLLDYVRHQIKLYEATGEFPEGAVDPHDIVDEIAREAEAKANERPSTMRWLVWMFHLMHKKLQQQRNAYKRQQTGEISTEKLVDVPELSEKRLQPLEQIVQDKIEPDVIREEDIVPGSEMSPDEFVAQKEQLEQMLPDLAHWPWIERQVFELYFMEGFEPDEIAKALDRSLEEVQTTVKTLQTRVKEQLTPTAE